MNIELEGFHTETGPGVYETAIRYDDALRAADKAALFKTMVKIVARKHGLLATFMAKWNAALPGCSGHIHQSLSDRQGKRNLFYDRNSNSHLSDLMQHYMAGQLALMREFTVMYCPTVNSYKRTVPGTWAPTNVTWGIDNRTTALRAIAAGPKSTRVECRLSGADANPYLSLAASLSSGLHGIENKFRTPPAHRQRLRISGAGAAAKSRGEHRAFPVQQDGTADFWRRIRRSLLRHPRLGNTPVPAGRDGLGIGTLLRDHLIEGGSMSRESRISIFSFPTRIVFGAGAIRELGGEAKRLGIERPLLVTDRGIVQCGIAESNYRGRETVRTLPDAL